MRLRMWLRLTGNAISPSGHSIGECIRCLSTHGLASNLSTAVLAFAEHISKIMLGTTGPMSNNDVHFEVPIEVLIEGLIEVLINGFGECGLRKKTTESEYRRGV